MKVKLNPMFEEARGQLGDMVFRELRGETVASRKPNFIGEPTVEQMAHRERFKLAAAYGKSALADPVTRELYEVAANNKKMPVFALTVADYFNAPTIHEVDLSAYNGQSGEEIAVTVTDDFAVASVHVKISDDQANVLESGFAENTGGTGHWVYSATTNVAVPVTVDVVAKDRPGGVAVQTVNKSLSPS